MSCRVVALGECMIELARTDHADQLAIGYAGDTYNSAVYLARLGLDVAFLTATGADPFSQDMRAAWRAEGVDARLALTDSARMPGLYAIRTDEQGERSLYYWRGESAARHLFEQPDIDDALERAGEAQLLYVSGISLSLFGPPEWARIAKLAKRVRERGGTVAFDPNYRERGWESPARAKMAIERIATTVSVVLPTFEDEVRLQGDASPDDTIKRWQSWGVEAVILKQGPEGCIVAIGDDRTAVRPAAPVIARDTTGAGDAFNAGYLAARQYGHDPLGAAAFANRLAGETVQHRGAIMPHDRMPALDGADR